jgi:hypothetical protein
LNTFLVRPAAAIAAFVYASAGAAIQAQEQQPALQQEMPVVPLSISQKYLYSVNKVLGPGHLFAMSLAAGLDQAFDRPSTWGGGSDAYGVRIASQLGRSLVRESIAFGVRAADHEDPRYFVLGHGGAFKRTRYAVAQTFVVRNDSGGRMPAYSRFVADYGMPFIAEQWRPTRFRTTGRELRAGTTALGFGATCNIIREFWPDVKRKVLKHTDSSWVSSRLGK